MSNVDKKNTWLILNLINETGFTSNFTPYLSRAGNAAWTLSQLEFGEIIRIEAINTIYEISSEFDYLVMKIINEDNLVYYLWYQRTLRLEMITLEDKHGEIVYPLTTH